MLHRLAKEGLPLKLVPPDRARYFARSLGRRAKTDAIDAAVLAHMAEVAVDHIKPWMPPPPFDEEMRALVHRRVGLVRLLEAERKRRDGANVASVVKSYDRIIRHLHTEKVRVEKRLNAVLAKNKELQKRTAAIECVPGVGRITALTLLTEMPELSTLRRTEAAALAGVAPYNNDSGETQGHRHIRGGRGSAYRKAYKAYVGGEHDVVFPYGTFKMARQFGVACEKPPP